MSKIMIAALAMVLCAGVSLAKDGEIAISKVPEVVKNTVIKVFPAIQLKKAEIETKKGKLIYEIKGVANGKTYEFKINKKGELLKMKLEKDDDDKDGVKDDKDDDHDKAENEERDDDDGNNAENDEEDDD